MSWCEVWLRSLEQEINCHAGCPHQWEERALASILVAYRTNAWRKEATRPHSDKDILATRQRTSYFWPFLKNQPLFLLALAISGCGLIPHSPILSIWPSTMANSVPAPLVLVQSRASPRELTAPRPAASRYASNGSFHIRAIRPCVLYKLLEHSRAISKSMTDVSRLSCSSYKSIS
jgi:hypothetical protein